MDGYRLVCSTTSITRKVPNKGHGFDKMVEGVQVKFVFLIQSEFIGKILVARIDNGNV